MFTFNTLSCTLNLTWLENARYKLKNIASSSIETSRREIQKPHEILSANTPCFLKEKVLYPAMHHGINSYRSAAPLQGLAAALTGLDAVLFTTSICFRPWGLALWQQGLLPQPLHWLLIRSTTWICWADTAMTLPWVINFAARERRTICNCCRIWLEIPGVRGTAKRPSPSWAVRHCRSTLKFSWRLENHLLQPNWLLQTNVNMSQKPWLNR